IARGGLAQRVEALYRRQALPPHGALDVNDRRLSGRWPLRRLRREGQRPPRRRFGVEVEAKFAITGALEPAQIQALELAPYTLRDAGIERHSDALLDTPSHAITSAQRALRIRTI